MFRILPLLIIIIQIVAIVDVVQTHRDTERKVLWIIAIIILPVIGSLAWYLVSRGKLKL